MRVLKIIPGLCGGMWGENMGWVLGGFMLSVGGN